MKLNHTVKIIILEMYIASEIKFFFIAKKDKHNHHILVVNRLFLEAISLLFTIRNHLI